MSLAAAERAALADTLEAVGPDRPTLCEGWASRDLLVHLLVRERQSWASAGLVVPALAALTERAARRYDGVAWTDLVRRFRSGPPPWSPYRLPRMDALLNGAEHFVHHEDVRRGAPGWEPRPADAARDEQLWAIVRKIGPALYRRSPVGVVLRRPDGREHVVNSRPRRVTITGEPGELLLHAFGRCAVRLEAAGGEADVAAMSAAPRGI